MAITCFNHSLFTTLLLRYPPFERIQGDVHIDYVWTVWYNHVMALFDKCMIWRLITTGHKNKKPWNNAHLQKLKSRQNRLYRQFLKHTQDPVCHSAYKLARNSYRLELRKARENQHRRLADDLEDTRRGTYHWRKKAKTLCQINNVRSRIPNLHMNNVTAETPAEKVEMLSSHFSAQCTSSSIHPHCSPNTEPLPLAEKFSFTPISASQVCRGMKQLSTRKATADPELVPVLRHHVDQLCESLAYVFNKSLDDGCFPQDWKLATVSPLYKGKGEQSDPSNYTPINYFPAQNRASII